MPEPARRARCDDGCTDCSQHRTIRGGDSATVSKSSEVSPWRPGLTVLHHSRGLGLVIEFDERADRVVIEFRGEPGHPMSTTLAERVLRVLPEDGLASRTFRDPSAVSAWARGAPLKLVAAALIDHGGSAGANALQETIEPILKGMTWKTWWWP